MGTVRMVGYVDFGKGGIKRIHADINDSVETISQAIKDGFQFINEKDAEKYQTIAEKKRGRTWHE